MYIKFSEAFIQLSRNNCKDLNLRFVNKFDKVCKNIKFLFPSRHSYFPKSSIEYLQIDDGSLKSLEAFNCGLSGYLIRDLAIRTRDGSVLEGRVVGWEKHSGDSLGGMQKEQRGRGKGIEVDAFARLLARSFIRREPVVREIKPGKSRETRIAAFLRRLLSAGDILSAITSI